MAAKKRKKKAQILPVFAPMPMKRAYLEVYKTACRAGEVTDAEWKLMEAMPDSRARDERAITIAGFRCALMSEMSRVEATFHAWLRGRTWATAERYVADVERLVAFVDAELPKPETPLAPVIPINSRAPRRLPRPEALRHHQPLSGIEETS